MTISEFRAWLEGFEEAIDGAPTQKQWKKIKQRLDSVRADAPVTIPSPFVIERYPRPWWPPGIVWTTSGSTSTNPVKTDITWNANASVESNATMLGRAEAKMLAATN